MTNATTRDTRLMRLVPGQRVGGIVAVVAIAVAGFTAFATPAGAATTGPTAQLANGTVTVTGTGARDVIDIEMSHDRLTVDFGFNGTIDAQFAMSRVQRLSVSLGDGNDGLAVIGTGVGDVPVTVSGGAGTDGVGVVGTEDALLASAAPVTISGNGGADSLSASVPGSAPVSISAGTGDDVVFGGDGSIGSETISLGDGNDKFVSTFDVFASPFRARRDTVRGGTGQDRLELRGTFESDTVDLSADAGHLIVTHDQGRVDAVGFDNVTWFGFGGNDGGDSVIVRDLTGTGIESFTPNFSSPFDATVANNSADALTVIGTPGDDHITVTGSGANVTIAGLAPTITPVLLDRQDALQINTLDGNDTVDSSGLQPGLVQLRVI